MDGMLIAATVGTLTAVVFFGALFAVIVANAVITRAHKRDEARGARAVSVSHPIDRLASAVDALSICVRTLEADLEGKGRTHA